MTQHMVIAAPTTTNPKQVMSGWAILGGAAAIVGAIAGGAIGLWSSAGCMGWFCGLFEMLVGGLIGYGVGLIGIVILGNYISRRDEDDVRRGLPAFAGALLSPVALVGFQQLTSALGAVL